LLSDIFRTNICRFVIDRIARFPPGPTSSSSLSPRSDLFFFFFFFFREAISIFFLSIFFEAIFVSSSLSSLKRYLFLLLLL